MQRIRHISSLLILLLVSNLSLAAQMLVIPPVAETEISSSIPPCHQTADAAEKSMTCCNDDCGSCWMSSLVSAEPSALLCNNPSPDFNMPCLDYPKRDISTLYRPPILA